MTKIIPFTQFRAQSPKLLDEVNNFGITIIITKRGKEVGRVIPPVKQKKSKKESILGCMRGTVTYHGDIIKPVDVKWNANEGKLFN